MTSVELAHALAAAVLDDTLVRSALALQDMLAARNPLALVRAVEIAEDLLTGASPSQATRRQQEP